ncbi:dihydrofolate reductase [Peptostreptococcaceae bacterium OttesenSCG-928-C18]|nr:dihydrofolate reductase [Peptostreptococcaceae bacterium OttesenSCG-928-C18]
MNLILIVAVDRNFGIGLNGDMLFYIKDDLKRFKQLTINNIIIMGRGTFEALPGSKELEGRTNIVLSRSQIKTKSAIVVKSIKELDNKLKEINPYNKKKNFLIGGGKLITTLWNNIDKAIITVAEKEYKKVDTFIPNIFEDKNFKITSMSEEKYDEINKFNYRYYEFTRDKTVSL